MKTIHVTKGAKAQSAAFDNRSLSFRAKGILTYLLSAPDGSEHTEKSLAEVSSEGVAALRTALRELEVQGYVRTEEKACIGEERSQTERRAMRSLFDEPPEQSPPDTGEATKPDKIRQSIERIISHLNVLRESHWTWSRYTPLSSKHAKNVEHIGGRLRDGYSADDLELVLDYLATIDGGKEESRKYFDCVTPFNTKNFERNLVMARDWAARGRKGRKTRQLDDRYDPDIYEQRMRGGKT